MYGAELQQKYDNLRMYLQELGSVAIAFSSGVDSTFLLKVAHDVLGDHCIAVTVKSHAFPKREFEESNEFCEREGIRHFIAEVDEMQVEGFKENPKNRCYLCKKEIFRRIQETAAAQGIINVAEGSNMDDNGDYRPGMIAIAELGFKSPLRKAELYKSEIRELSKELNLPTWSKPSYACLASRFAYGETITREKLDMVDKGEQLMLDLGFQQFRVRIHGNMARLEVLPGDFGKLLENRELIVGSLKSYGFTYVSMDLQGYRTGSMNETLNIEKKTK